MEEVVFRRYKDFHEGVDSKGIEIPELIVIDGGAEQLKRAHNSIKKLNLDIYIIGLAKREEEIYLVNKEKPLNNNKNRPGMLLLRAGRDEAHRFAITYQKKLRQKEGMRSILDEISGIGPKRKKILLNKYKSVSNIAKESSETLSEAVKITQQLASDIIEKCRKFVTDLDKSI